MYSSLEYMYSSLEYMYSRFEYTCIQTLNTVYSKCIQSVFKVYSKCIQSVFKVYSNQSRLTTAFGIGVTTSRLDFCDKQARAA